MVRYKIQSFLKWEILWNTKFKNFKQISIGLIIILTEDPRLQLSLPDYFGCIPNNKVTIWMDPATVRSFHLIQNWVNFFCKGQIENTLSFAVHLVSVTVLDWL